VLLCDVVCFELLDSEVMGFLSDWDLVSSVYGNVTCFSSCL
jgi:hypothetical protein